MGYDDNMYYDINGNPITVEEWSKVGGSTNVGRDIVDGYLVSTVHLGLNHAYGGGPHLTFETMIFLNDNYADTEFEEYQERYHTLEEAKAGHQEAIKWLRRTEVWK